MTPRQKLRPSGRLASSARGPQGFYGWWILAMAVVIFGWTGIGQTQGFSVLLLPLTAHVGVSERDISLVFLVGAFGGAFLMPVVGRILDARGARRLLIVATVCYAIAFCLLALVPVKAIALGSLLVVRLIGSIVLWLGASVLVAWWFSRHRGLALGLLLGAGSGLLALLVYGLSISIGELGFAPSFLLLAVTACAMLIPMLIWGVVDQPSELGSTRTVTLAMRRLMPQAHPSMTGTASRLRWPFARAMPGCSPLAEHWLPSSPRAISFTKQ